MEEILSSTLRLATPLVFAAIGGMYSERAGVVNIALDGKMLLGAFAAAWGTLTFHNPWVGLFCAILSGLLSGILHGILCVLFRAEQIVAGTAINCLAYGLTPVLCRAFYGASGSTPNIPLEEKFLEAPIAGLSSIPFIGPVFFNQNYLVYLSGIIVFISFFVMKHTVFGLRIQAVGDHPEAADTAGISVIKTRMTGVMIAGMIAAMGGAFLSIAHGSGFSRNMTSGRGFMALAALIFGKWRPLPACLAALLFGFADAIQIRLQGNPIFGFEIPVQFIQILPYFLTIFVLTGFIGKVKAPLAIGQPFQK